MYTCAHAYVFIFNNQMDGGACLILIYKLCLYIYIHTTFGYNRYSVSSLFCICYLYAFIIVFVHILVLVLGYLLNLIIAKNASFGQVKSPL